MRLLIGILIISYSAFARDEWLCSKNASYRSEDTLYICGEGTHFDESRAKNIALESTIEEYRAICSLSMNCRNRQVIVTSHRVDCNLEKNRYKCLRLVEFEVTKKLKEINSGENFEDFLENENETAKIDWNQAVPADLTNYSFSVGYIGLTSTFKDYSNLTPSGLYLSISKRVLSFLGLQASGSFGRAETDSSTPTTLDFTKWDIGLPFYYGWQRQEVYISPMYHWVNSSIQKGAQKFAGQRQAGPGLELGYSKLFYFSERDSWYAGITPKLGVIKPDDSQDLKAANSVFYAIFALTIGFRR